jgi:O-antigen ligase
MRFVAAFTAFALPLAIAPGLSFFHDVTPKLLILLIASAAAVLIAAWNATGVWDLVRHRAGQWLIGLLGASILITVVSTTLAADPELAWYGSTWRRLGAIEQIAVFLFAGTLAAAAVRSPAPRVWFLRALCFSGSLAAVYAIFQYFGLDPLLPVAAYHAGEGPYQIVRPPSTLGHSDYFGAFALWPVFIGFAIAASDANRWWRIFGRVAAVIAAAGILLSGSRAPLLGVVAGVCCWIALRRPRFRTAAAIAATAAVCIAGFYLSPAGARLRARVHWVGEEPLGGARLLLWRDTLSLIGSHPATGVGPENFIAEFPRVQSVALSRAYPDFYHESPHNFLLDAAAGEGIPGLAIISALCLLALSMGYRQRHSIPGLSAGLTSGLVAAIVAHQFTVLTIPGAVCFYVIIALLAASSLKPEHRQLRIGKLCYGAYAIGILTASLFVWIAWREGALDRALAMARGALDEHRYPQAAQIYDAARDDRGCADLYFSRRWATVAAEVPDAISKMRYSQLAVIAAMRATRDPEQRANAWYNLAAFAAIRNDHRAMEAALRTAVAAAPNWFKPHWTLARLLAETNRLDEARAEALRAVDLDAGKNPQVGETARQLGAESRLR